jgi:hypothetical protein
MPSKNTGRIIERATKRIPLLRQVPVVKLIMASQVVLIAREHIEKLEVRERRRIVELLRDAHGMPGNLSPAEQNELRALVAKAEPRLFAGLVADQISPVPLPDRVIRGDGHGHAR